MSRNLVIVESPAKAKTIAKYLGAGFEVKSSIGHIRGLPSKQGSVDVTHNFAPKFEVDADKKKVIAELKKAVKDADVVWLASDEDREGEAIAWHLSEVLGLDPKNTKRIVFHEITKTALEAAVKNPRTIDMALVEAQQARQTLDYLVGFELSPVLWRKVRPQLSAGRVQSVAVRIVVDREGEITNFSPERSFKLTADFNITGGDNLPATSPEKFSSEDEARVVLEELARSSFTISSVEKKPGMRQPGAPFTTSSLQQEASSRLGLSPRATMQLAQRLYEAGHITYMRTDSLNLSDQALGAIKGYVENRFGTDYHQWRTFKTKSAGAQEAHEAIRPTDIKHEFAGADERQKKLYNLIWKRTLSSQMAPAKLERTVITIVPSNSKHNLEATGEIVIFDGFLKVYPRGKDDVILPNIHKGEKLDLDTATASETLSRAPARYTEASLVKKLEEMGIGRPSTYASILSTIETRGYVERGDVEGEERQIIKLSLEQGMIKRKEETTFYGRDKNKLLPSDTGKVVTDFLIKYFPDVVNYDFTRSIEAELDEVADGQKTRLQVLEEFYGPFHTSIDASKDISRAEVNQARLVGQDPVSNKPIYARFGRFGPMLQKGDQGEADEKPAFAPLPAGTTIDTVTLEKALDMFKLPRIVGRTEGGEEIKANIGRFGPYVQVGKTFVSIKPLEPQTISEAEARQLINTKQTEAAARHIADFGDVKILSGRFGPYVTNGTKNAKIPKGTDPQVMTLDDATKLLESAPVKSGFGRRQRTTRRKP